MAYLNPQGLTPQEMGAYAEKLSMDRIIAESKADPGILKQGGTVGSLPTGTGSVPVTQQAFTWTEDAKKNQLTEGTPIVSGEPGVKYVYSASAGGYVPADTAGSNISAIPGQAPTKTSVTSSQGYEIPLDYTNVTGAAKAIQSGSFSSDQKVVYDTAVKMGLINPEQFFGGSTQQYGTLSSDMARGVANEEKTALNNLTGNTSDFFNNILSRMEQRGAEDVARLSEQSQAAQKALSGQQAQEKATQEATAFKLGRTGTMYGVSEMQQLAQTHRDEMLGVQSKYDNLIMESRRALEDGEIDLAKEYRTAAQQEIQNAIEMDKLYMEKEKNAREAQKYAREDASETFSAMASAGYVPSAEYLAESDKANNWEVGTSQAIYESNANKVALENKKAELENAKSEADLMKTLKELEGMPTKQAGDLVDLLNKVPFGKAITIGGVEYVGMDRGDIKTGTETDANGFTTFWEFNPETGETNTFSLGQIGKEQDGWEKIQDDQGRLWSVNPKTQEMKPFFLSEGAKSWQSAFPDGSTWMRNGQPAPECGQFVNDLTGAGVGDSFESKMAKTDSTIGSEGNPPAIGDFFVQKMGTWTGHIGIVAGVETGPDGKQYVRCLEQNYPSKGKITSSRVIPVDQVDGFGRTGKFPSQLTSGSDASGSAPTFGLKETEAEKPLTPYEIKAYGLDPKDYPGATLSDIKSALQKGALSTPLDMTFDEYRKQQEAKYSMSIPEEDLKQSYDRERSMINAIKSVSNKQKSADQRAVLKDDLMELYRQGDEESLQDRIKTEAYSLLAGAQKTDYDQRDNAIAAWDKASSIVDEASVNTGPLKTLFEENKSWANINKDPKYVDLKDWIELGQAAIRKSFYGTAVTDTEAKTANNFLVQDQDLPETIAIKLRNGTSYMNFVQDLQLSKQLGLPRPNLDDYLIQ